MPRLDGEAADGFDFRNGRHLIQLAALVPHGAIAGGVNGKTGVERCGGDYGYPS